MTASAVRAVLEGEAAELEAAIGRLGAPDAGVGAGAGADARAELERRVLRLCGEAQALPAAEARRLAEPLARLIAALDAAAERLRGGSAGDSAPDAGSARRAAAAYGSAATRRRRGF